jgi:hypothetical protein
LSCRCIISTIQNLCFHWLTFVSLRVAFVLVAFVGFNFFFNISLTNNLVVIKKQLFETGVFTHEQLNEMPIHEVERNWHENLHRF